MKKARTGQHRAPPSDFLISSHFNGFTTQQSLLPYGRPPPTLLPAVDICRKAHRFRWEGTLHSTNMPCGRYDDVRSCRCITGKHAPCDIVIGKIIFSVFSCRLMRQERSSPLPSILLEATRLPGQERIHGLGTNPHSLTAPRAPSQSWPTSLAFKKLRR